MRVTEALKDRNNANFIEQKYIQRVLKEGATDIMREQDRIIGRFGVGKKIQEIGNRRFTISSSQATFTHPIRQRFIDMKYRNGIKQKVVPVHNKVIYNHFNGIIGKLAFGFTQDVRELIANQYDIQL